MTEEGAEGVAKGWVLAAGFRVTLRGHGSGEQGDSGPWCRSSLIERLKAVRRGLMPKDELQVCRQAQSGLSRNEPTGLNDGSKEERESGSVGC